MVHQRRHSGLTARLASRGQETEQAVDREEPEDRKDLGVFEFVLFALIFISVVPSLGPRVPDCYHRTDILIEEVRGMVARQDAGLVMEVEDLVDPLQQQDKKRSLLVATVRAQGVAPRARMLVVANEHARELVTGEIALSTLRAASGIDSPASSRWRELLDRGLELSVVPVANVEGRRLADATLPCQRGTADMPLVSTDLNRNFPVDWTPGVEYNYLNSSFDFHGTGPFSAYQARALRELATRRSWDAFVDLHSGSLSLNVPFGHLTGGGPDLAEQLRAQDEARKFCPKCRAGPLRETVGYDSPGQLMDWMYKERGVVYSYLWEVFGRNGLCAPHFNPMDEASLRAEEERWTAALASLADYVLAHRTA